MNMVKIGWFSTGRDKAARDLLRVTLKNIDNGTLKGRIIFNFCDRIAGESGESDRFLKLVERYKIPSLALSSKLFSDRQQNAAIEERRLQYDREVMQMLAAYSPDICMLAGYMRIVGREMCTRYKMINLHPALPGGPKGSWQDVIWQLLENRSGVSGVMLHLVSPELDAGPVITYCTYPIRGVAFDKLWKKFQAADLEYIKRAEGESNILFKKIRQQGLRREFPLIILTLKAICDGTIKIRHGAVYNQAGKIIQGYDLTQEINQIIGEK